MSNYGNFPFLTIWMQLIHWVMAEFVESQVDSLGYYWLARPRYVLLIFRFDFLLISINLKLKICLLPWSDASIMRTVMRGDQTLPKIRKSDITENTVMRLFQKITKCMKIGKVQLM